MNFKQKLKEFKAAAEEDMKKLESSPRADEFDGLSTTAPGKSGRGKPKKDKSDSDDDMLEENPSDSDESTWELDEAGEKQRKKLEKLAREKARKSDKELGLKHLYLTWVNE